MAARSGTLQRTAPLVSCPSRRVGSFPQEIFEGACTARGGDGPDPALPSDSQEKAPDSALRLEKRGAQQRHSLERSTRWHAQASNWNRPRSGQFSPPHSRRPPQIKPLCSSVPSVVKLVVASSESLI